MCPWMRLSACPSVAMGATTKHDGRYGRRIRRANRAITYVARRGTARSTQVYTPRHAGASPTREPAAWQNSRCASASGGFPSQSSGVSVSKDAARPHDRLYHVSPATRRWPASRSWPTSAPTWSPRSKTRKKPGGVAIGIRFEGEEGLQKSASPGLTLSIHADHQNVGRFGFFHGGRDRTPPGVAAAATPSVGQPKLRWLSGTPIVPTHRPKGGPLRAKSRL